MTEQERKLVIDYITNYTSDDLAFNISDAINKELMISDYYKVFAFKRYALRHAFKDLFGYIGDEIYRRWINLIVKYK